jgi:DNA-3-methyladenine glycosylase II
MTRAQRPSNTISQSPATFADAVSYLARRDDFLARIVHEYGQPDFWHRPAGFSTLVLFILEQQVSLASGAAAFNRIRDRLGEITPEAVLLPTDEELRADGFSRQKARYVRELAKAVLDGRIDLAALVSKADDDVVEN